MSNVPVPGESSEEGKVSVSITTTSTPSHSVGVPNYLDVLVNQSLQGANMPSTLTDQLIAGSRIADSTTARVQASSQNSLKRGADTALDGSQQKAKRLREFGTKPMHPAPPIHPAPTIYHDALLGRTLGSPAAPPLDAGGLQQLRAMFPGGNQQNLLTLGQFHGGRLEQQAAAPADPNDFSNLLLQGNLSAPHDVSAQLLRDEIARSQGIIQPQLNNLFMVPQQQLQQQLPQEAFPPATLASRTQQVAATLHQIAQLGQQRGNPNLVSRPFALSPPHIPSMSELMGTQVGILHGGESELMPLLRQIYSAGPPPSSLPVASGRTNIDPSPLMRGQDPQAPFSHQAQPHQDQPSQPQGLPVRLPPCQEGNPPPNRPFLPLGIDEDPNWLSEFHCFVRSDLMEIIRASHDDVKGRNNSIGYQQVGLRCRFCAHVPLGARAGRSSAFPSSLRQIYQSFTMMLRDHFVNCDAIPAQTLERFVQLKDKPSQGATDSKRYWMYSATKIGMTDTPQGIIVNEATLAAGSRSPPFGTNPNKSWEDDTFADVSLVLPSDRPMISEFLFELISQVQPIRLTEAECIGNRRSLRVGLPGFGCRYCCKNRRLGLCRMFPARRRTLPSKVSDLYDHLRRCTVCPDSVKIRLERAKQQPNSSFNSDQGGDHEFFDLVWSRLGHESQSV